MRFADLPEDFLTALQDDIHAKRGAATPAVRGGSVEVTAYLAGRPYTDVTTVDGFPAEPLTPWL
ncbi:hypothetical protein [Streptomyces sp. NRRL WC-3618]|uniref:hypothetical protein n=1 Tax=Streptomyces sp. NRRL WC-3618 TaxID=1519490 RepID=UPI000A54BAAE|nr:hypothetical protein [Streptomyces sp. NRRL WC-3618]